MGKKYEALGQYLDYLSKARIPACDLVIFRDHAMQYRHMAGFRDTERTRPLRGDETYCLYSCSKVFTSCAAMQLAEQGKIGLDDPVAWYLPAYSQLRVKSEEGEVPARKTMTVRHLLSMQSGLNYDMKTPALQKLLLETGHHASTREIADTLAAVPLEFEPGTDFLYSLSHDVLAAVIEAVSGKSFGEYLQESVFDPLEMKTIGFALKEYDRDRQCAQYQYMEDSASIKPIPKDYIEHRLSDRHESGGAGLISDVQDYITFADAIACGGTGKNGARILSPETICVWNANQLIGRSRKSFDVWNRRGYSYALGVRTRVDLKKGGPGTIGEFGWDGAAGSWVMMDPDRHLSAFFAMHVRDFGYVYDVVHPKLRSLIYEAEQI